MFYILSDNFVPNSAPTNHALSFLKGFSELGIKAQWVFLLPDAKLSRWKQPFKNISVRYLWNSHISYNRYFRHIYKHITYSLFYFFTLKKGDIILLLGASNYLHGLIKRKGISVYHERTEHPLAVNWTSNNYIKKHYYSDCALADGNFVISAALKEFFVSVGVPNDKVHVINMVVDANRFSKIKKDIAVEPYIAYCGNASNLKDGVDDLIKAFALVAKCKPDIKLYIIGQAPAKESNNYDLVEKLGIKDRIVFTGVVSADDMPQILTNAQMQALCRPDSLQNKYGFPTKLGEYLLTGNPVVITRVGDIPLFLEHKKTALISECGDIEAFAENIIWVIEHPDEAREIGLQGKKVAEQHFNYLIETKKMVNIMFNKTTNQ